VTGLNYFVSVFNVSETFVASGRDNDATRAKADGEKIWLREGLTLAVNALGSEALAKARLRKWLVAGDLPWDCKEWEGPDAAAIARLKREREEKNIFSPVPPPASTGFVLRNIPEVPYAKGDPRFWEVAEADWDDNTARDTATGARAWGITVSRAHLFALLPQPPDAEVPSTRTDSGQYAFDTAKRLKAEDRIWFADGECWVREDVEKDVEDIWRVVAVKKKASKANVARLIAWEMDKAAKSGGAPRPLKASSLENVLAAWGIWPLNSVK